MWTSFEGSFYFDRENKIREGTKMKAKVDYAVVLAHSRQAISRTADDSTHAAAETRK
jgi:hypothetical protein